MVTIEQIEELNARLIKENEDRPYQEANPCILVNGYIVFYSPVPVRRWHGGTGWSISASLPECGFDIDGRDVISATYFQGHGV